MKVLAKPPCVLICDRDTGIPYDYFPLLAESGDKVTDAGEQVACFLFDHADTPERRAELESALYIHITSDGLPADSFTFEPTE